MDVKTVFNCRTGVVHAKHGVFSDEFTACGHAYKDFPEIIERLDPVGKVTCFTCSKVAKFLLPRYEFKLPETPKVAVDAIIHVDGKIVLIKRKYPPLGYAFPGGFVDVGESCEDAVVREVKEEVNLNAIVSGVLGVYSDPSRDERGHIISIAYLLAAQGTPKASDDAKEAFLLTPKEACKKVLIADHKQMLIDFYNAHWDHRYSEIY